LSLAEYPTRPPFFALHTRSLATARIALGDVLLLDLALRAFDLRAHDTDDGVPEDVPERRVPAQGVCVPSPVAALR